MIEKIYFAIEDSSITHHIELQQSVQLYTRKSIWPFWLSISRHEKVQDKEICTEEITQLPVEFHVN